MEVKNEIVKLVGPVKEKRPGVSLCLLLIILLVLTLFLGVKKKTDEKKISNFQEVSAICQHKLEEAEALLGLNPAMARTLLSEVRADIETLEKDFKKGSSQYEKIEEMMKREEKARVIASQIFKIDRLPLFFDLSLVKEGAKGSRLSLYKDNLLVLDKEKGGVYKISLKNKSAEILAGGLKSPTLISVHGEKVYLLGDEGILTVVNGKTTVQTERDEGWGEIASLVAYGGNLYLLDKRGNQIYKYLGSETGFSERKSYLNFDVKPDLSSAASMAVDGSIFVISGNNILKFTAGQLDKFNLKGLDKDFNNSSVVYTDDQCKNVYVLDNLNRRVVVLDKDGLYQAQYQWEGLIDITDMVVSESEKKILLLSGENIYQIEIK